MTHDLPELNNSELEVMDEFWSRGALSAREVHDRIADRMGWSYSTTRTVLERLVGKETLTRRRAHGIYVYEPAVSRVRGLAAQVRNFAHRVLRADPAPVVSLFADAGKLSPAELRELKRLVEEAEE